MKKYVEVDREPVVGDMVKIVKLDEVVPCTNGVPDYKLGDVLKIIHICEVEGYRYKDGKGDYDIEKVLNEDEFIVVEEVAQFSKSDLRPCMVVKTRDGGLYLVAQHKYGLSLIRNNGWLDFDGIYNNDLIRLSETEWSKGFDIMEVYDLNEYESHAMDISTDNRELLFKREEQSPRDIKIKELQDKMDEIKREMEELK